MKSTIRLAGEVHDYDSELAIAMPPECHRALREFLRTGNPPFRIEIGESALEIKICWVGRPEASLEADGTVLLKASRRNILQIVADLEDLAIPNHPLDHFHTPVAGEGSIRNLLGLVFERTGDDDYARLFHMHPAEGRPEPQASH